MPRTFHPRMGGEALPTLLPARARPCPAPSLPCCHPGLWHRTCSSGKEPGDPKSLPGCGKPSSWQMGCGPEAMELGLHPGGHNRWDSQHRWEFGALTDALPVQVPRHRELCLGGTARPVHPSPCHVLLTPSLEEPWCPQGCSACGDEASLRRWIPPSAPSAQPGHGTSSRLFNLPALAHSSAPGTLSPPGNTPRTSCPPQATHSRPPTLRGCSRPGFAVLAVPEQAGGRAHL